MADYSPAIMTYGSYTFSPVPLMTLTKEFDRTGDDTQIGSKFQCTLEGTLTPLPTGTGGLGALDDYQDDLRDAFSTDGALFQIVCGVDTVIQSYPKILGLDFKPSNNNWTLTTDFTINLEWVSDDRNEDTGLVQLKSVSEEWVVEPQETPTYHNWDLGVEETFSFVARVTHNVSAVGKREYSATGLVQEPWLAAQAWVIERAGWSSSDTDDGVEVGGAEILGNWGAGLTGLNPFNHMRTQTINEDAGEFSLSEHWTCVATGTGDGYAGPGIEDFTVNVRSSRETDLTTVGVEGSIEGLATWVIPDSGAITMTQSKYAAAEEVWGIVQTNLYARATGVGAASATRTLNPSPNSTTVGHNPTNGRITYSYEYNDRPCSFISDSLSESINIQDTHPVDVFASLVVIGRARGPILQNINTVTAHQRSVTVEISMSPYTGCGTGDCSSALAASPTIAVECVLKCYENELTAAYESVFKSSDTEGWNPITGRYQRQVGWTYTNCTGDAPDTTLSC